MAVELSEQEIADIQSGKLDALKPILDLGLQVRTKEQQQEYENNLASQLNGRAYKVIETTIEEVTGIKKEANEKATDYLKRAVEPMKTNLSSMQSELAALKEKKDDGTASKEDKDRIKSLETMVNEQKAQIQALSSEKETAVSKVKVDAFRERLLDVAKSITLSVDTSVAEDVREARINRFNKKYELRMMENGKFGAYKDGELVLDTNTLAAVDPAQLMREEFADVAKTGNKREGSDAGKPDTRVDGSGTLDLSQAQTKNQVTEALFKAGIASGTKEFTEAFDKAVEAYQKRSGRPMPLR